LASRAPRLARAPIVPLWFVVKELALDRRQQFIMHTIDGARERIVRRRSFARGSLSRLGGDLLARRSTVVSSHWRTPSLPSIRATDRSWSPFA
jgi:hypothetical protein